MRSLGQSWLVELNLLIRRLLALLLGIEGDQLLSSLLHGILRDDLDLIHGELLLLLRPCWVWIYDELLNCLLLLLSLSVVENLRRRTR